MLLFFNINILSMNHLRNQVRLIGRLGADPELKNLEKGKSVVNISLATNDYYKGSDGELQKDTTWHKLTAWGKTAENMSSLAKKGDELAIDGKIQYKTYENKEGVTVQSAEILINEFMLLGNKKSDKS